MPTTQDLDSFYIKQGLSTYQIAKLLGFSQATIYKLLVQNKIPLRESGRKRVIIPEKDIRKLYLEKKFSSRRIAKIYGCAYSTIDRKIKKSNVTIRNRAVAHIKTNRISFSGDLTEKAYLIGLRIGDLRVRKRYKNSETISIDCASTKSDQINLVKSLFSKYGNVWISKPRQSGKIQIECGVDKSFSFLLKNLNSIPSWVLRKKRLFLSFLAGFSDAEGSFFITKRDNSAIFSLGNYNKILLGQIREKLVSLKIGGRLFRSVKKGYKGKDGYYHRQDYWILSISRKLDLHRLIKLLIPYLKHPKRILGAKIALSNIKVRNNFYSIKDMT